MRAMRIKPAAGLNGIYLDTSTDRDPGPGEITVKIYASSLNFHDYAVVTGLVPAEDGRIPLSDGAGVVTAIGTNVTEFEVGDKVVATFFPDWCCGDRLGADPFSTVPGDGVDGYAAEEVTRPATAFTHAPTFYTHLESATIACAGLTAWRALTGQGGIKPGDIVLTQGTGGVSIFAIQFAKAAGARVIATSSSDEKLEKLKALGADYLINYRKNPNWGEEAARWSGGGVDRIVEVGGAATLPQSIAACRNGGQIALIGVLTGFEGKIPTSALMAKQIILWGLTVGNREQQQDMVRAIEASGIRPVIDSSFALEELSTAFRHQESGQHFGKICVTLE
ncbi:MAG: NAD(P)-dependent alcohol dehydrogenase [Pseudomonadota bacterium]